MLLVESRGRGHDVVGARAHRSLVAEGGDEVGIGVRAGAGVHEAIEVLAVVEARPDLVGGRQDVLALLGALDLRRQVDGGLGLAVQDALEPVHADIAVVLELQQLVDAGADPGGQRSRPEADDGSRVHNGEAVQGPRGLGVHVFRLSLS